MGGRNTSRSERVMSSGNMPPVCSKRPRRSAASVRPKRLAMPGRYHTGSTAAFTTLTSPLAHRILPSGLRRPAAMASRSSGMLMCARVTAMEGRMSMPWSM